MKNLVSALTKTQGIVLIIVGALFVLILAWQIVRYAKNYKEKKEESTREVDDVKISHGIRYTEDMTVTDKLGDMNISFGKGDLLLRQGTTYIVDKKTPLKPGKYTVLATHDTEDKFNIRVGTYVKEYFHNQEIILAEGEEVTAVSANVILR